MTQYKVKTQMNKVYVANGVDYTALVAKGCLCLYGNHRRSVAILNTAQVLKHGTYLEIKTRKKNRKNVCLSFRNQADLGSCFDELSKWSDRTVESAWEISKNVIGRGAQGVVFHGKSTRQGTDQGMRVAVKITKGKAENEVHTNVRLENDAYVMVALDVLRDNDSTYIVMPYLEQAETLHAFLIRKLSSPFRILGQDTAKLYMSQILMAVAHLHAAGIYHGDLHWGNVMVLRNPQKVNIIDFGTSNFGFRQQKEDVMNCGMILRSMKKAGFMGFKVRRFIDLLTSGNVTAAEALKHEWFEPGLFSRIFRRRIGSYGMLDVVEFSE